MTFNLTRYERVLGLAGILATLAFPARAWARQVVAERPQVEFGASMAALAQPYSSAIVATPRVSWNLDSQTAIDVSADVHDRHRGSTNVSNRIGYIQLKRSLFTSGGGRFFVTAGGAAGRSRSVFASSSYR